ncbi:MAG: carboxypeptidase-like regulatory domain-containing protein, partial [Candidatus Angelobacter sp.]
MKCGKFVTQAALLPAILFCASFLFGQAVNFAQIQGRVEDPTGATIPAAKVTATNVDTGLVRRSVSNADGAYSLPNLPVGHYKLDVEAAGFKEYVQSGIILQVNESPVINVSLQVGAISE